MAILWVYYGYYILLTHNLVQCYTTQWSPRFPSFLNWKCKDAGGVSEISAGNNLLIKDYYKLEQKLWEDKIWIPKIKHSLAQYIVKQRFIKTKYSGGRYHTSLPPCWWEVGKWWRMLPSLVFLQIFRVRATRRQIPGKFPEHPLQQRSSPQQQRCEYKQFIQEEEIQI